MSEDYNRALNRLTTQGGSADTILRMSLSRKNKSSKLVSYQTFTDRLENALYIFEQPILIAFSVDHLQELNLTRSWVIGDTILYSLAELLKQSPANSFCTNVYGGTFLTFFNPGSLDSARLWATDVCEQFSQLILPGLESFPADKLSLSTGIYCPADKEESVTQVLLETNAALKRSQQKYNAHGAASLVTSMISNPEDLTLCCSSSQEDNPEPLDIKLIQLNNYGLSFECPELYNERDEIELTIRFKTSSLSFAGKVACGRASLEGSEHPYNISAKFLNLTDKHNDFLNSLLQ